MALALADSIADVGWDLNDQAQRYVAWWRTGDYSVNGRCFDIGITTGPCPPAIPRNGRCADLRRPVGEGQRQRLDHAAGPGADRLTPASSPTSSTCWSTAWSSRAGRPTPARSASRPALPRGGPVRADARHAREEVLDPALGAAAAAPRAGRRCIPRSSRSPRAASAPRSRREIEGSGYVVRSLEAALWAFHDAADFREAVLRAVNLGDDADTTGAVCGQLAGACSANRESPSRGARTLPGRTRSSRSWSDSSSSSRDHRRSSRLRADP